MGRPVSAIVDRAIADAGLSDLLLARRSGAPLTEAAVLDRLRASDLLVLGALADRVRREEVGETVRIYAPPPERDAKDERLVVFPDDGDRPLTGLELLREIAIARVTGPISARLRVDWTRSGLELAQVALGFGASELAGHIASKRGLPIALGELSGVGKKSRLQPAHVAKKKELAAFVRRADRTPVFVGHDGSLEAVDEAVTT